MDMKMPIRKLLQHWSLVELTIGGVIAVTAIVTFALVLMHTLRAFGLR
ncbi:MAG: hypothetical protein GWO02_03140 [Gammaproteobacteria bacterium]|nr:hypothetical protein [Gammaproteobacteria bacterium]